uniref:Restriction endonuclease type IV Mrr domain-containing protein n=1 Tax=Fervidicoccus fontis TaxID=683846 RepID=A0A7J3ZKT1_9CREN
MQIEEIARVILQGRARDLAELSRLVGKSSKIVLDELMKLQGVSVEGGIITVSSKVMLAVSAIELGASPLAVSSFLNWREFEEEVKRILEEYGARCTLNFRISRPKRAQVDVIGVKDNLVLVVDCKHWNPRATSPSRLQHAAEEHKERVGTLARSSEFVRLVCRSITPSFSSSLVLPVLITLSQRTRGVLGGAIIVPIGLLRGFLAEIDSLKYELPHITVRCPRLGMEGARK